MMILIFAGAVFVFGVALLVRAIRGRVVSVHPHCRGCKFDLHGLTLSRESVCPECGRAVIPGTVTVMDGRRVFRRRLAVVAVLLMLVGGGGLAWPSVSRMPAIKNMDWYAKFPEGLLLRLEEGGDKKALQALHDRLIPGTLSDEGLQQLIGRSLAMVDDESVVWDERWGDVLLYGLLEEQMTPEQLDAYLRRTYSINFKGPEQVGSDEEIVYFHVGARSTGVFACDQGFLYKWKNAGSGFSSTGNKLELRISIFHFSIAVNGEPVVRNPRRGFGGESSFSLNSGNNSSSHSKEDFPLTDTELDLHMVVEYQVESGDTLLHTWEEEMVHTFERVDYPIVRVYPAEDRDAIEAFVESIFVDRVGVPINLKEAKQHRRTKQFGYGAMQIGVKGEHDISLIGKVHFRVGEVEIEPIRRGVSIVPNEEGIFSGMYVVGYDLGNLRYFEENRLFWMQVVLNGKVDVVITPNLEAYFKHPEVRAYLEKPIVFRDVPIKRYQPHYGVVQDSDGNRWNEWRWDSVGKWKKYDEVYGEFLDDD
jgi:predicted RNA-binding Zn-ribbon protein involved in translation (DUF1610 family)